MTKVLKLNVTYWGNYGGDVDETMILPLNINGVVFSEVEQGTHRDAIGLGEIEGKHSDVDGDLVVSVVDLDELSLKDVSDLVEISSYDTFEGFFYEQEEALEEDEDEFNPEKANEVYEKYSVNLDSYQSKVEQIHEAFIKEMKEKYVQSFKTFNVKESDYELAARLLKENGIELFD